MSSSLQNSINVTHIVGNVDNDDDSDTYSEINNNGPTCTPTHDIFFLKTHKCASTTLQNIFMRYGLKRNLSFAIPRKEWVNLASYPDYFRSSYIEPNREMKFNVFCHHCRFHYDNIRQLMPTDTVFIGVVRNTVDVFQSGFHYFVGPRKRRPTALNYIDDIKANRTSARYFSQNPMLFDFGVNTTENRTELRRRVRERLKQFHLVVVSDYFEESIILMKNFLCWSMEDVVYVTHNQLVNTTKTGLSAAEKAFVQEWNYGDELLYSMVNRTFWKRVRKFGHKRMQSEIAQLRSLRRQWESTCILKQARNIENSDDRMKMWSHYALGYVLQQSKVHDEACVNLVLPEVQFTSQLHARQLQLSP